MDVVGLEVRERGGDCTFPVQVTPRASRDRVVGVAGGVLRLRIQAPPVAGEANERVLRFLAKCLGIPRGRLGILQGESSRRKVVRVSGLEREKLLAALGNP